MASTVSRFLKSVPKIVKFLIIPYNKPQAAPPRFAPRRRGGGLEGICRAEVDSRTAASPRGETIAVQQ